MRIGEVTTENYKEYLKILGVKDTTNLDKLTGGKTAKEMEAEFDHSFEAMEKAWVANGGEAGMIIREGDTSWKKIIPVSDAVKDKLIETIRNQIYDETRGKMHDVDEIPNLYRELRKSIAPSDRLSFTYTASQIVREEAMRIRAYIEERIPGWKPGQAVPADILKAACLGDGYLDMKA
jgi:hypothetical protein